MVRNFLLFTALLGLGCNEKPGAEAQRLSGSSTLLKDAATEPKKPGTLIKLPSLSGLSPKKTLKPLTQTHFEELSKLGFEAFTSEVRALKEDVLSVRLELKTRPKIGVHVLIQPCSTKAPCDPIQLDKWPKEKLRSYIAVEPLRNTPDLTLEVGMVELQGGARAIFAYQLGRYVGPDAIGEHRDQYLNGYDLYFNDSINQIRVATFYADDALPTKEALARAVPRELLERIGKALVDYYTQAWGN